jgi:hypothetical protein
MVIIASSLQWTGAVSQKFDFLMVEMGGLLFQTRISGEHYVTFSNCGSAPAVD